VTGARSRHGREQIYLTRPWREQITIGDRAEAKNKTQPRRLSG
jgi:hypothetical protein